MSTKPPVTTVATRPADLDWNKPTNKNGLELFMPHVSKQLARAMPKFLEGAQERLMRCMLTETSKNPNLLECTPVSLFGAVIQAGQLGLAIGGFLGESYLIPFKNSKLSKQYGFDVRDAQLIIGYKGMIQLAHRSNAVRRITPIAVRQGDVFRYTRGLEQTLIHEPKRNNVAPVCDYYVVIELMNGGRDFETFSLQDAVNFRDRYATVRSAPEFVRNNSPWYSGIRVVNGDLVTDGGFDAMALKTLIRRIGKRTPVSVEWSTATSLDEAGEEGHEQNLGALIDMPPAILDEPEANGNGSAPQVTDKASELKENLDRAKAGKKADHPPGHPEADPYTSGEIPK